MQDTEYGVDLTYPKKKKTLIIELQALIDSC